MALVVPDVGEVELLKRLLYGNAGSENLTLKLFSNNITPAESDTATTYTEATFAGYVAKTLTSSQAGATWAIPTTAAGVTSSTYQTNQVWTISSGSQTVYGYYVIGATSTVLLFSEAFATAKALSSGDTLTITPKIQLD